MTFGEKLLKLRKESGLSQEALAEKLNTTRQAISKWENSQGYPETEKIIKIGSLFKVSIDYLLKDTIVEKEENTRGFYVSREMAAGFLLYQEKSCKYGALGTSLITLSSLPYWIFDQNNVLSMFLIILIATLGIGVLVIATFSESHQYKILKKESLLLDQSFLKELSVDYYYKRKRYFVIIVLGYCLLASGLMPFLFEKKNIISGVLIPYYPFCTVLIAIGSYILLRTLPILHSYNLLVKNEEYVNRLSFKLLKKGRKRLEDI